MLLCSCYGMYTWYGQTTRTGIEVAETTRGCIGGHVGMHRFPVAVHRFPVPCTDFLLQCTYIPANRQISIEAIAVLSE